MTLNETARALVRDGAGIFIADEGINSGSHLFSQLGIAETEENYCAYRTLIATTEGIETHLSTIMLPREAFRDMLPNGTPLYDAFAAKGIMLGLTGAEREGEKLSSTLSELRSLGVVCASFQITRTPTEPVSDIRDIVRDAIGFMKTCHESFIVPILSVSVLSDGVHTAGQAEDTLIETLSTLGDALDASGFDLGAVVLASSMAVAGRGNPLQVSADEVADRTVRATTSSLPESIAGIVFLSNTETPEEATANFNAIARTEPLPWPVAFSFSDAFEQPVIALWKGSDTNVVRAQSILSERLSLAGAADAAGYARSMEDA